MKILMITATYRPSINGVAISLDRFYHALVRRGHTVKILAPKNQKIPIHDDIITYPSLPNPLVHDYPIPLIPVTPTIMQKIRSIKFDVVHAHQPYQFAVTAKLISWWQDIPFVYTYHSRYDAFSSLYVPFLPSALGAKLLNIAPQRAVRWADLVIAPSRSLKSYLETEINNASNKIKVVPTGIVPRTPTKTADLLRRELDIPQDTMVLLSVARLSPEKNINLILEALDRLPDRFHLLLIGDGPARGAIERKIDHLDLNHRVTLAGSVAPERLPDYYQAADLFVFASLREAQGISLIEAQYYGLPVVSVNTHVNREWIGPHSGILVQNTPEDFSAGIKVITQKLDVNVKHAAHDFAKQFTIEKTAQLLESAYNSVKKYAD